MTAVQIAKLIINKDPEWRRIFGAARNAKIQSYGLDPEEVKSLVNKIRNGDVKLEDLEREEIKLPESVEQKMEESVDRFIQAEVPDFLKEEEPKQEDIPVVEETITEEETVEEVIEESTVVKVDKPSKRIVVKRTNKKKEPERADKVFPTGGISFEHINNDDIDNAEYIKYHVVKKGETLKSIASSYDIKVIDLMRWNNIKSPSIDIRGRRLRIKGGK